MTKRKRKKRPNGAPGRRSRSRRPSRADLQKALERADSLIARDRIDMAIELLEPLLASYPREADLHYYLGYARAVSGDTWGAMAGYERAQELSKDPTYWLPLVSLYIETDLHAHALRAFRQATRRPVEFPWMEEMRRTIDALEEEVKTLARDLGVSVRRVEEGLYHMERGQRRLQENDFSACIAASQQAIKLLGDWPPPHNNLSLALFFDGQPEKAIDTARRVLSGDQDNVQALGNAIRFLAWTGREAEARALWARLEQVTPQWLTARLKIVEAAAVLGEDEHVYQLLHPLERPDAARDAPSELAAHEQFTLAIAEANTGRQRDARRRLRALQENFPYAGELLAALKAGRPGPGWAERFPYFHSVELMPTQVFGEFVELIRRQDEMDPEHFRSQVARFVSRFPQIVLMAEKMIWEEDQPEGGIAILSTVATPAAYAALRRFGLSQAGEDDLRMQALTTLVRAGEIKEDETVRVWIDGKWQDTQIRGYEISDGRETSYSPEVAELLNTGLAAYRDDKNEQAEQLFQRALELEPRAKEAYNNLGAIYAARGDHEQAREMFRAAVEVAPLYPFPRCNLAVYLLDEGDVAGAEAMLEPLSGVTHFSLQEIGFYSYVQARLLVQREEYENAQRILKTALQVYPGYALAEEMLKRIDLIVRLKKGYKAYRKKQQERDRAKRARLQAELSTPDPTLSEALPLYTKNALTGMAREALPWGGWTALRKGELVEEIVAGLTNQDNLERMVEGLGDEGRTALRQVLAEGGSMPWQDFDARYGNDVEESPYWEWHTPETTMGQLRLRGLLVEATVEGELRVAVPLDLRAGLGEALGSGA